MTGDTPRDFDAERRALAAWFRASARDLPWRSRRDPYTTWLSEIMLQQTRVEQALPYFERFVTRFPDVRSLADASIDDVLRAWEGLGYYSRARNLHRAARDLVQRFDGRFPSDYDSIRTLPGVGAYTAAAIASQAFGLPCAAVDSNVVRVLTRFSADPGDPRRATTRRRIDGLAASMLDPVHPGTHNEALMELGARVCRPRSPRCSECPLSRSCRAFAEGQPEAYPTRVPKRPVPHFDIAVGVLRDASGRLFIQRRPDDAMLGGLWEFPGGKVEPGETPEEACRREIAEELGLRARVGRRLAMIRHAYSHFRITLHAFDCTSADALPPDRPDGTARWVAAESLADYAFPRANRRLVEELRGH